MTDINLEIARLVQYGVKKGLLHQEDAVFAVNRILALLKLNDYTQAAVPEENLASPQPILNRIIDWAAENGLLESNSSVYRDLLDTEIMACLMPRPSVGGNSLAATVWRQQFGGNSFAPFFTSTKRSPPIISTGSARIPITSARTG